MENLGINPGHTAVNPAFWQGKRVLVTGHTGFKGGWLTIWLHKLGAEISGLSLQPEGSPNLFRLAGIERFCTNHYCDIRDLKAVNSVVEASQAQIVFHLAAQPLVRASYAAPIETLSANVMGTAHVLDALRGRHYARVAVAITTDKVYRNNERPRPYRETDTLGGHDPYSASKAACEIVIDAYRQSFLAQQGLACASARAGNVIGGGDWSADRLIPDAVRSWQAGLPIIVRNPKSVRPWQHVLEPLAGYLRLAERLWQEPALASSYNFGPDTQDAASVEAILAQAQQAYGGGEIQLSSTRAEPHEARLLALDTAKVRDILGVTPKWSLNEAIIRTMQWYSAQHAGADALKLCQADISAYEKQA